jgi:peptidoglycan/LPS O-acetylase OafA/YrhL
MDEEQLLQVEALGADSDDNLVNSVCVRKVKPDNSSQRMVTLDAAKYLAALGVIWIHVCQTPETSQWSTLGRFAVPFFAAAAGYLLVGSLSKPTPIAPSKFLQSRITRLYAPFACWSLLYVVAGQAKAILIPDQTASPLTWDLFYVGGAYHLWFIPYLIAASSVGYFVCSMVGNNPDRRIVAAGCAYLAGLTCAALLDQLPIVDAPLHYMAMTTPGFLWGASLGWVGISKPGDQGVKTKEYGPLVWLPLATMGFSFIVLAAVSRSTVLENASGTALLVAALFASTRLATRQASTTLTTLGKLGQVSLGIYFSHLLVVKLGEVILQRTAIAETWTSVILLMLLATIVATIFSLLAARFKATRWLVG